MPGVIDPNDFIATIAQVMTSGAPLLALPGDRCIRFADVVEIDYAKRGAVRLTYRGGAQSVLDREQSHVLLIQIGVEQPDVIVPASSLAAVPNLKT